MKILKNMITNNEVHRTPSQIVQDFKNMFY